MRPPARVTVPTCVGCGAMSQVGTCDRGCSEAKLELVHAVDYDALTAFSSNARERANAFRIVIQGLATTRPDPGGYEVAYRTVQAIGRATLRRSPPAGEQLLDPDAMLEHATTWWCEGCGGLDAPQPCLGICIWRPIDWVNAELYDKERARALAELEMEVRWRTFLRRVASVSPRDGHWERGWHVLRAQAQQTLADAPTSRPSGIPRAPEALLACTGQEPTGHRSRVRSPTA